MLTRRDFVKLSLGSLTALATQGLHASNSARPLGVQLYTVRSLAQKDLPGVLAAIHKVGYQEVETYWDIYDRPAKELRQIIADHGLRAPSGHFDYQGLGAKLDYAQELGVDYVVCPMLPRATWNSLDGFKTAAAQFNQWGEEISRRGMRFAFHNHNYEFRPLENTTGFATLMTHTDPKIVKLEMDCYWITQAGKDPVKVMNEHADRITMLHLKDRQSGFPFSQQLDQAAGHFTEVGTGSLDWKAILAAAARNRIQHMFVEQDESARGPIESVRISYQYLQNLV
jgi:sugar phosphate isomerase/epimerase